MRTLQYSLKTRIHVSLRPLLFASPFLSAGPLLRTSDHVNLHILVKEFIRNLTVSPTILFPFISKVPMEE